MNTMKHFQDPNDSDGGGEGSDDGCDHGDHSEDSNADSPDTDSGSSHW